jgi:hypothetical protein
LDGYMIILFASLEGKQKEDNFISSIYNV